MNKGCLIFAHNTDIDYASMAILAAKLVGKHLDVPVSLVTDTGTLAWMKDNDNINVEETFDKIIFTDDYLKNKKQIRRYYDGSIDYKKADFKNGYRAWAFEYSPYEQTLVIDVDFLVVNDRLNNVWDSNSDFMINRVSQDLARDRKLLEFNRVSDHGIEFFWATAFYFKKYFLA